MTEEILINVTPVETRVALVENGMLQEIQIERNSNIGIVDKINIGKIRKELTEKNQQISELNDKVKLLKIAGSVGGGESTKEVKLKINEMVREIDKCIAQINR